MAHLDRRAQRDHAAAAGLVAPASARSLLTTGRDRDPSVQRSSRALAVAGRRPRRAPPRPSFGRRRPAFGARGDWTSRRSTPDRPDRRRVRASAPASSPGVLTEPAPPRACRRSDRVATAQFPSPSTPSGPASACRHSSSASGRRPGSRRGASPPRPRSHRARASRPPRRRAAQPGGRPEARAAGFRYRIEVADLAEQSLRDRRSEAAYAQSVRASALPSGRTTYRRLPDYTNEMKFLAAAHTDIVQADHPAVPHLRGPAGRGPRDHDEPERARRQARLPAARRSPRARVALGRARPRVGVRADPGLPGGDARVRRLVQHDADDRHPDRQPRRLRRLARGRRAPGRRRGPRRQRDREHRGSPER